MSSKITRCAYDPTGNGDFTSPINPFSQFNSNGAHDISKLVHRIVATHLGYTGNEQYTLTLKRKEITLVVNSKADSSLRLENGQWKLRRGGSATNARASNQISNDVNNTLDEIKAANTAARGNKKATRALKRPVVRDADDGSDDEKNEDTESCFVRVANNSNQYGRPTPSTTTSTSPGTNQGQGPDSTAALMEAIHAIERTSQEQLDIIRRLIDQREQQAAHPDRAPDDDDQREEVENLQAKLTEVQNTAQQREVALQAEIQRLQGTNQAIEQQLQLQNNLLENIN